MFFTVVFEHTIACMGDIIDKETLSVKHDQ